MKKTQRAGDPVNLPVAHERRVRTSEPGDRAQIRLINRGKQTVVGNNAAG